VCDEGFKGKEKKRAKNWLQNIDRTFFKLLGGNIPKTLWIENQIVELFPTILSMVFWSTLVKPKMLMILRHI
jgi:hypothetical protein